MPKVPGEDQYFLWLHHPVNLPRASAALLGLKQALGEVGAH